MTSSKQLPGQIVLTASSAIGIILILVANMILPLPIVKSMGSWTNFLILLAAIFMVWSVLTMGRMMFAAKHPRHLVTHGLYRYSRHPFYFSLILGFLGLALVSNNWLALGAALLIVLPVQVLRAMREEEALAEEFGEEWAYYKSRTSFMIPGLW